MKLAGAQKVVLSLAGNLNKDEFHTIIASLYEGDLIEEARRLDIDVTVLRPKGIFDIRTLYFLVKFLKKKKIDVIHSHGFDANYYGAIAARIANTPVSVITEHGRYWLEYKRRIFMTKLAAYLSNAVVAVSEDLRESLLRELRIKPSKVITLYNGIDCDKFTLKASGALKASLNIDPDELVVGNVANLRPVKGQVYLLSAAALVIKKFGKIKFVFAGEGESRAELESEAGRLGISSKVIFLGQRHDIAEILSMIDIFVISSLSEEISLAILEAMAAGKAVIATDVGGNPEIISNEINGLLVAPKDETALSEAILRLLSDRELAGRLGKNAHIYVNEKFSLKNMVDTSERLYKRLLNEKRK